MIKYDYITDVVDPDANNQSKKRAYLCKNCHVVLYSLTKPPTTGCPTVRKNHDWIYFSQLGKLPKMFTCRKCGLRIFSSLTPDNGSCAAGSCENKQNHSFCK